MRTLFNRGAGAELDRMGRAVELEDRPRGVIEIETHPLGGLLEGSLQRAVLARREPLAKRLADRGRAARDLRVGRSCLRAEVVPQLAIGLCGHHQDRRRVGDIAVHDVLRGVPEKRRHRVKLALLNRIELVVVAGGATDRETEKDAADGLRPVLRVDRLVFLRNDTTLIRSDVVALKSSRHELVKRWIRQQVAGNLLHRELVERLVLVQRLDDPVTIGVHLAVVVDVDPMGITVARRIKPVARPMLAPVHGGEQRVDQLLVGLV